MFTRRSILKTPLALPFAPFLAKWTTNRVRHVEITELPTVGILFQGVDADPWDNPNANPARDVQASIDCAMVDTGFDRLGNIEIERRIREQYSYQRAISFKEWRGYA